MCFSLLRRRVLHGCGFSSVHLGADLKHELPFAHEEPFILVVVDVERRTAPLGPDRIIDAEVATGILRRYFAIEAAVEVEQRLTEAILIARHVHGLACATHCALLA